MPGVELERGAGGVQPLVGAFAAAVTVRCLGDDPGEALGAQPDQQIRVRPAFQDREISVADLAGQWVGLTRPDGQVGCGDHAALGSAAG
jgi:hypothetical protein